MNVNGQADPGTKWYFYGFGGVSAGNEGAGKYRIDLYSDQEGTKTGQYFRYIHYLAGKIKKIIRSIYWSRNMKRNGNMMRAYRKIKCHLRSQALPSPGSIHADRNVSGCTDPFHDCLDQLLASVVLAVLVKMLSWILHIFSSE